jgi:predicted transglutaminase-like cysteine proteinase
LGTCPARALEAEAAIEASWPREGLLITVVRDRNGDGYAVHTVKSDQGEFILDNRMQDILLWFEIGYQFVKRQSQTDPNL